MNSKRVIFRAKVSGDKNKKKIKCNKQYIFTGSFSTTVFNSRLNKNKSFPNKKILDIINKQNPILKSIKKKIKSPEDILEQRTLNAFFAFRIYYSQFGQGINQKNLSTLLATEWKKDLNEQQFWNNLTEQYKQIKDM
ncbi:transcriptional co-activator mating type protein alpha PWA37_002840 [Arxiozyma heterogenica]|uniref:Alpha box domain-containing protein n=1 Tax=Arxiozyma heterogenica TaxID=278026 RepID=A0AAN7WMH4_9SACH|nr:hypothetical protein RI543_003550 [Kazachstania heterogenica]